MLNVDRTFRPGWVRLSRSILSRHDCMTWPHSSNCSRGGVIRFKVFQTP